MVKTTLIVVATAIPAFGAGFWTESTLAEHQRTETRVVGPTSTISPFEMHRKVKPDDLPVQYKRWDTGWPVFSTDLNKSSRLNGEP